MRWHCSCSAQSTSLVLGPHKPIGIKVTTKAFDSDVAVSRSIVGGPWMLNPSMHAKLYIRNVNEVKSFIATPILYISNGKKVALPPVTIGPAGVQTISIDDALLAQGIAPYANLKGYAEIDYTSTYDPLCATIVSVDTVHSVVFTYGFGPTAPVAITERALGHAPASNQPASQRIEGLWWKQSAKVSGFVSLSNTTGQSTVAQLTVTGADGSVLGVQPVTLDAHATEVVDLAEFRSSTATSGGAQVTYSGLKKSVLVSGGLEDIGSGYSATMTFRPFMPVTPGTKTSTLTELGLMTGAADPMMKFPQGTTFSPFSALRNISADPVAVTPEMFWMQSGSAHRQALPALTMAPGTSVLLDTHALLTQAGLASFNGTINFTFTTPASPSALLLSSGSVDQTASYVFQVLPHVVTESVSKTLSYWSTANGNDTMVTIWNPADEAQDFLFALMYTGGNYVLPIHLEARASHTFNIASLIADQLPDQNGSVIPATITEGSAKVSGVHADNERILVDFDAGTYNVQKATCMYYCVSCTAALNALIGEPASFALISPYQLQFMVNYGNGSVYSENANVATWTSGNTSMATIASNGVASANAVGTFDVTALSTSIPVSGNECAYNAACPYTAPISGGGTATVTNNTPIITGLFPTDWYPGTTQTVTYDGQYFGTNVPSLGFNPSGGISYSLANYNDTQIVANITVAPGTPTEDVGLSVTSNGYGGLGFQSGGGATPSMSSFVNASIKNPPQPNVPEITIIAWLDGTASDLVNLPGGENSGLQSVLNGGGFKCSGQIADWAAGVATDLTNQADRDYANTSILSRSSNPRPPTTINVGNQYNAGTYRLFNDWLGNLAGSRGSNQIGGTPNPCGFYIPNWVGAGQASTNMGAFGISPFGKFYKVAEGRIGSVGQQVSATINQGRSIPWIYDLIEFDTSGNVTTSDHASFPTYYIYTNGTLTSISTQSSALSFAYGFDSSNETAWKKGPNF